MATDFKKNSVSMAGGIIPTTTDTPGDIRTRVETEADITSVPKPYVGMMIYVKDTGKRFEVLSLKDSKVGLSVMKDAAVDEYREVEFVSDELATDEELELAKQEMQLNVATLEERLIKLLYKAPEVKLEVICTPDQDVIEKGYIVNVAKLRCNIEKGSDDIVKIIIKVDGQEVNVLEGEDIKEGGVVEHAFDAAIELEDNILEDYFRVEVQDASNNIVGVNGKAINFVCPFYFGVIDENAEITGNIVNELEKTIEVKEDKTYEFSTDNQHMVIAYPKEYGELAKVVDANGFNLTASFAKQEIMVMCFDEHEHEYYVYKNGASTVSKYEITFKF